MGRLDDHAKRRIVELRRAGLSFRKIKKVLELDNIRVTPQAVYLFLKRKSVELGPAAGGWGEEQPWPPLQGHEAELHQSPGPRPPTLPSVAPAGGQDGKEGTQIVSVASFCQGSRQPGGALPVGLPPGKGKAGPLSRPALARAPCSAPEGLGTESPFQAFFFCPLQVTAVPRVPSRLWGAAKYQGPHLPPHSRCLSKGGSSCPLPRTQP